MPSTDHLDKLARAAGASPEAVVLGVWAIMVERLQKRMFLMIPGGTTAAGAAAPRALSRDLDSSDSLSDVVRLVQEALDGPQQTTTDAPDWEHECWAEAAVIDSLPDAEVNGARLRAIDLTAPRTDAALVFTVLRDQEGGKLVLLHDERVLPAHAAGDMLAALGELLAETLPDHSVETFHERLSRWLTRRYAAFLTGPSPRPQPHASAALAFAEAARASERPAVRHRTVTKSYGELAGDAGGIAAWLRQHGVGRGDIVATLLDRSSWIVAAALGAWAAGAAYVHIDPEETETRIAKLLALTGARAVIVDSAHRSKLPAGAPAVLTIEAVARAAYVPDPHIGPGDLAYLVFTSGSTGTPKAVAVEHGALLNYVGGFWQRIAPLQPESFGVTTSFASDLGKTCIYAALLRGCRLDIYDRHVTLDPFAMAAELQAQPVACMKYTPSQLEALMGQGQLTAILPRELLILGGESFSPGLARAILAARPDLTVFNHYGPSETTIGVLMHRVDHASQTAARVPLGRPLAGVSLRLLDPQRRQVPHGLPGVLYIGGPGLARGYFGDPASTSEKFLTGESRWYRTDDLAICNAAGEIEFLGRVDRQLKIRGNRVEPGEVEAALCALPGVVQAVVTGEKPEPDAALELVAYVVARPEVNPAALIRGLQAQLPAALVPGRIHRTAEIPLTRNGKIDFARLREVARATGNQDTSDSPLAVEGPDAPRTATEILIAGIWSEVLGRADITRDAKFLELGGDSFKCLAVFGRLRRHVPDLAIAELFRYHSIADLAAALERRVSGESRPEARPSPAVPIVEV